MWEQLAQTGDGQLQGAIEMDEATGRSKSPSVKASLLIGDLVFLRRFLHLSFYLQGLTLTCGFRVVMSLCRETENFSSSCLHVFLLRDKDSLLGSSGNKFRSGG